MLSAYQYDVEFRPTSQHGNADGLSRLPLPVLGSESDLEASQVHHLQLSTLPVTADQLGRATAIDPILSKVHRHVMQGWPRQVAPELVPYHQKQNELSVECGCLFLGTAFGGPCKVAVCGLRRVAYLSPWCCENEVAGTHACMVAGHRQTN